MTRILGIDPGINGAWAIVDELGHLLSAAELPVAGEGAQRMVSAPLLATVIRHWQPTSAIVERVGAMPGQGVSSMFKFGRACGVVDGLLGGLSIPVSYVAPTVWKKALGLGPDKEQSRQRAIETWPAMAGSIFPKKLHHGRAEAALIALWAARQKVAA